MIRVTNISRVMHNSYSVTGQDGVERQLNIYEALKSLCLTGNKQAGWLLNSLLWILCYSNEYDVRPESYSQKTGIGVDFRAAVISYLRTTMQKSALYITDVSGQIASYEWLPIPFEEVQAAKALKAEKAAKASRIAAKVKKSELPVFLDSDDDV
jgi:hypothetical protein